MIITASGLVLAAAGLEGADNPVMGVEQLATTTNTTASVAGLTNYPATNVVNPATHLEYRSSSTAVQYITVIHNRVDPIDYIGIARHNLGSTLASVQVEGYSTAPGGVPDWQVLLSASLLGTDEPAILRFAPTSLIGVRLRIGPVATAPRIGVLYAGKLMICPRPIYVGHTPITLARQTRVATPRSESGNFLGRVILGQSTGTKIPLTHLPKDWVRSSFKTFVEAAASRPFFFAWRPQEFPREVGYCWLDSSPTPVNDRPAGFMTAEISVTGIAT